MKNRLFLTLFVVIVFYFQLDATTIILTKSGRWNNVNTWPNNSKPTIEDDVIIPSGITLTMLGNCEAKSITVKGKLQAISGQEAGASVNLKTKYIMVMGSGAEMEIGTAENPYISSQGCTITLVGSDPTELIPNSVIHSKAIMIMAGARLIMHGKQKKSWVKIGGQSTSGSTSITLAERIDWAMGDELILTSNRFDPFEAERKIITDISEDQKTIFFTEPLKFPRRGNLKSYSNSSSSWEVDTRAEAGLLSRNIKIQGDETSIINGYGGHIMIMNDSYGVADNIELFNMGQKYTLARYPWHWHMLGEKGNGQYIKNSSIHQSFNRAITIHGTWGTLVDNNVAYDHIGHGIFLEDGSEINNTLSNNLVVLTKLPRDANGEIDEENALLDTDASPSYKFQSSGPSSFWITNPQNTFVDNIVAGSEGTAYWFAFPKSPTGLSADDARFNQMKPFSTDLKQFDRNSAHSCIIGIDLNDQLKEDHSLNPNGAWKSREQATMNDLTFYCNYFSIYSGIGDKEEDVVFNRTVSTDALVHLNFATQHIVQNSIFISDTDNGLLDKKAFHDKINQPQKPVEEVFLYRMYDGAGRLYDSHLVNWNRDYTSLFVHNGGARKRINHLFKGLTYNHDGPARIFAFSKWIPTGTDLKRCPQVWSNIIRDLDGSITRDGVANSIVIDHPYNRISKVFQPDNWDYMMSIKDRFVFATFPNQPVTVVTKDLGCDATYVIKSVKCGLGVVQQQHLAVTNGTYEHSIYLSELNGNSWSFSLESEAEENDEVLIRFKGFGVLAGVIIDNIIQVDNQNDLENVTESCYYVEDEGDLVAKFYTTKSFKGRRYVFKWDGATFQSLAPESPEKGNCAVTNTNDILPNLKYVVYPNPSKSGVFTINRLANWEVYSINGSKLTSGNSRIIDLRGQQKGIYLLKIGTEIQKLVHH